MLKRILFVLTLLSTVAGAGYWTYYSKDSPYWQGRYIPRDLADAHSVLLKKLSQAEIEQIKKADSMVGYHHSLGLWMRNNWGLWHGSRLAQYFHYMGIRHADDMSSIIMDSLWCRLHEKPYQLEDHIKYYQAYAKAFADPPRSARTPEGHEIIWGQVWSRSHDNMPRGIHIGKDLLNKKFWAYEYDKGVYSPTKEMMAEIDKDDYWKTTFLNVLRNGKAAR